MDKPSEDVLLDEEMVPGTVHLIDVEGVLDVKKGEGKMSGIILQPQPSSNPNDPLRWSNSKKRKQFWLLWVWAFLLAVTVNWSGPAYEIWLDDLDCTLTQLNIAAGLCFAFLGVGCLFLQPTAMKLGRRFVYLLCTVICIVSNLLGSQAHSMSLLYASNILLGFSAAPVDSLVEISTTDVFFQHERAEYLSFLILALTAGSDLGPVAAGYILESMTWRWCFYFQIIIMGVLLVIQLFYMEDTTFEIRESTETLEEDIILQIRTRTSVVSSTIPAKKSFDGKDDKTNTLISRAESVGERDSASESIPLRGYWRRMQLIEREYRDRRSWFTIFIRPFFLVPYPAVIWGGLVYGSQMMWLSLLSTTQSEIYTVDPYNFSTSQVGLTNLGALIGSILGMFYGGKFVDFTAVWLARKNKGIFEPEFRLWSMILPVFINGAGLLAYGLSSVGGRPWPVSVIIGQGFIGFAITACGSICLSYAIDCYPMLASECLVAILVLRNAIGCGFTFAIQPWLNLDGVTATTWIMFGLAMVINGSFILMIYFGKTFRRLTAGSYKKVSDPSFGGHFRLKFGS